MFAAPPLCVLPPPSKPSAVGASSVAGTKEADDFASEDGRAEEEVVGFLVSGEGAR